MSFHRTQGLLAAGLGLLAFACDDPEFRTDLVPEGPPVLLSVNAFSVTVDAPKLVENFGIDSFYEEATFCSDDPDARVSDIYCFDKQGERLAITPMTDTVSMGWFVRPVFDELLDPDTVEDIVDGYGTINAKNPVTLECEIGGTLTAIAYDGWYDPTGNRDSDPPGPSIFVTPIASFAAPTLGRCQISVNATVTDKDGIEAPDESRAPHEFFIEELAFADASPADCTDGVAATTCTCLPSGDACDEAGACEDAEDAPEVTINSLAVTFNAPIDEATLDGNFTLVDGAGADVPFTVATMPDDPATLDADESDPTIVLVTPDAALAADTVFTLTVTSTGDEKLADVLGGEGDLDPLVVTFSTTEVGAGDDPVACPE
jgi:hypothetical protein